MSFLGRSKILSSSDYMTTNGNGHCDHRVGVKRRWLVGCNFNYLNCSYAEFEFV